MLDFTKVGQWRSLVNLVGRTFSRGAPGAARTGMGLTHLNPFSRSGRVFYPVMGGSYMLGRPGLPPPVGGFMREAPPRGY